MVKEATAVIDAEGLKVERLAVTEQIIDPTAPAVGSGESLLDKLSRFFSLDNFFSFVRGWTDDFFQQRAEKAADENKVNATERREREVYEQMKQLALLQTELRQREALTSPGRAPELPASDA